MKRLRYWYRGKRLQRISRILQAYEIKLCERCSFFKNQAHRPCYAVGCQCRCS